MNTKHLVLGMTLVSVSLSTCAYDGDLSDNKHGELFTQVVEQFETIKAECQNWYNGTNAQSSVQQSTIAQTLPVADQLEESAQEQGTKSTQPIKVDQTTLFGGLRDQITSIEINKEKLLKYGAGALIAVTISGITYVLYKNGTLQSFGSVVKQHPVFACAGVVGVITALYVHYC